MGGLCQAALRRPRKGSTTSVDTPIGSRYPTTACSNGRRSRPLRWKEYADDNQQKSMALHGRRIYRPLLLHALPSEMQRIRYYGLLGNRHRTENLARCRDVLNMPAKTTTPDEPAAPRDYRSRYEAVTGKSLHQCPACREGCMRLIELFASRQKSHRDRYLMTPSTRLESPTAHWTPGSRGHHGPKQKRSPGSPTARPRYRVHDSMKRLQGLVRSASDHRTTSAPACHPASRFLQCP